MATRLRHDNDARPALVARLHDAMYKPDDRSPASRQREGRPPGAQSPAGPDTTARSMSDKERLVGLVAAPFAAAISMLVIDALVANDPPARLKDGLPNPAHVSVSLYHDLLAVLIVLSVATLGTALLRKRLHLGMATALYGLAIFNLHYWGFGIPFIICAAWLLVRAYRLQRDAREATDGLLVHPGPRAARPLHGRPPASKRYTPPASSGNQPARPRSAGRRRAG
jgi:hypothetical protein